MDDIVLGAVRVRILQFGLFSPLQIVRKGQKYARAALFTEAGKVTRSLEGGPECVDGAQSLGLVVQFRFHGVS